MSTVQKRFDEKWDVDPISGCWLWSGSLDACGYGTFKMFTKVVKKSHRVSWELNCGPIPPGLWVLHRCDNPPCVNPAHLFLGTPNDNSQDMVAKGRASRLSKLSREAVLAIRSASGLQAEIAAQFGITVSAVSRIKSGSRQSRTI